VKNTGASYSLVFLNRYSVRYPRALVASGGTLEGTFASSGQVTVDGLLPSSVLLDTTGTTRWRQRALPTRTGLSFPVEVGRRYLATSVMQRPQVRKINGSALKRIENQADYLLLAPKAFLNAAKPLLELRQSEGLSTMGVSLEDIYEQFGHGEASPEAIKAFLEYAYQSWAAPSPRYVLLLGDASYDPKGYLGTGAKDWLPGRPVKTSYLRTVSDPGYASVNGDDLLPDLAIGRLPAGSEPEAQRLVEKVLAFENGGGRIDGPAVLVADNADAGGNFERDADEIASGLLQGRDVRKIYYSEQGANTRAAIKQAFDDGASLTSYVGHGATAVWASENIFRNQDVSSLVTQSRQPLLLTMNCLNGFFHFPPLNSLSEELLKADGKGAIAAFSPSGLSLNDAAHVYHEALLREILSGRHARLGDAILAAQREYAHSGALPELLSIYHLFGDPALRIR
jgi:Peptidase family C25